MQAGEVVSDEELGARAGLIYIFEGGAATVLLHAVGILVVLQVIRNFRHP